MWEPTSISKRPVFWARAEWLRTRPPVRIGSVTQISATVRIRAVHSDGGVPAPVTIDRNVWISAGTPVCAGVAIGNDAFVTAGAVVLSDVAKGATVAGNPASPLG